MADLEAVEDILSSEEADRLREAKKANNEITEEERERIRNNNEAIEYTVETLSDPERSFEPTTAAAIWDGKEVEELSSLLSEGRIVDAIFSDMQDVQSNEEVDEYVGTKLLSAFRPHIVTEGHSTEKMAVIESENDYDTDLLLMGEEIKSWWEDVFSTYEAVNGGSGILQGWEPEDIEEMSEDKLRQQAREKYQSADLEIEEAPEAVAKEMLGFFIEDRAYLAGIDEKDDVIDSQSNEKRSQKRVISSETTHVDWEGFAEKYGSVPDSEMRDFYETALEYHSEDQEVGAELLMKLAADVNGMDVDYEADEKDLADNFGSLKKAVCETEGFDYALPVMDKERELQRTAETIEKAQEFYQKQIHRIER